VTRLAGLSYIKCSKLNQQRHCQVFSQKCRRSTTYHFRLSVEK
jgi:hypothetical protein